MLKGVVNPIPSVDGVTDGYVPTASGGVIIWAAQSGGGGGSGTVTSVAMTVPTGLTVSGTPITSSGTFAVALDAGYVIPTQAALDAKVPYSGATATLDLGAQKLQTDRIDADSSSGLSLYATNGTTQIGNLGASNTANVTWYGSHNYDAATASTIASFGASKTLSSLSTATYPSLTELSYVKDVTSAIQTQLNAKATKTQTFAIVGKIGTVANQDYDLAIEIPFGGTIVNTTTKSTAGTCTATFKVNTTALGGTANSVSTTQDKQAHSSSNTFSSGDDIRVTVSSNSSCANISFTIEYTRSLS